MTAQHSAKSVEWGTPPEIVEWARRELGGTIDLDPASNAKWNGTVRATKFLSSENDAVGASPAVAGAWADASTVFLNPPGRLVGRFWDRLIVWHRERILRGLPAHAIWIGFSVEQLSVLQDRMPTGSGRGAISPLSWPTLILRKRLAYVDQTSEKRKSPTHSSYITIVGHQQCSHCGSKPSRVAHNPAPAGVLVGAHGVL
jgi:hypothetical protein